MVGTSLRYLAILCSAFVVLSFGLFAIDETRAASATTRQEIADSGNPDQDAEAQATADAVEQRKHSEIRRTIDDVNEQITSPFASLVNEDQNRWVQRLVPALLALLVFGVGLGFLARYAQGRSG